jgi:hypothetical protein
MRLLAATGPVELGGAGAEGCTDPFRRSRYVGGRTAEALRRT